MVGYLITVLVIRLNCLHESLRLAMKENQQIGRTFVHPYARGDNNTMGTSINYLVGQIAVFVEKGMELC